jgi:hypothetical protein
MKVFSLLSDLQHDIPSCENPIIAGICINKVNEAVLALLPTRNTGYSLSLHLPCRPYHNTVVDPRNQFTTLAQLAHNNRVDIITFIVKVDNLSNSTPRMDRLPRRSKSSDSWRPGPSSESDVDSDLGSLDLSVCHSLD